MDVVGFGGERNLSGLAVCSGSGFGGDTGLGSSRVCWCSSSIYQTRNPIKDV